MKIENEDTEKVNITSKNIDTLSTIEILKIINSEDEKIAYEVYKKISEIGVCIDKIFNKFKKNGRVFYVGAGTSGRLGMLDASEIHPTYGESNIFAGIIAGGRNAISNALEGVEDDVNLAEEDFKNAGLTQNDTVIGITASGNTPYVLSFLSNASKLGLYTIGLCMSKNNAINSLVNDCIYINTGPEVISGSTRMKAGTATKMVLNMISTTLMIKLGKVYKNLMIDVLPKNIKLKRRAIIILQMITNNNDLDFLEGQLEVAKGNIKAAAVMIIKKCDYEHSIQLLKNNDQNLRRIIG